MPGTATNRLPAGYVLAIVATASQSGLYRRVESSGAARVYDAAAVAASSTVTAGPFTTDRQYEIISLVGDLSYTIAQADLGTSGTGDALRANSPTIATPTITQPQTAASVNGAITIAPGTVVFTKAGVLAGTLAAPTAAQAGIRMTFMAGTDNAHTLTATGLIDDGVTGGSKNLATFAAFSGSSLTLEAYNLKWSVIALNAVVIS